MRQDQHKSGGREKSQDSLGSHQNKEGLQNFATLMRNSEPELWRVYLFLRFTQAANSSRQLASLASQLHSIKHQPVQSTSCPAQHITTLPLTQAMLVRHVLRIRTWDRQSSRWKEKEDAYRDYEIHYFPQTHTRLWTQVPKKAGETGTCKPVHSEEAPGFLTERNQSKETILGISCTAPLQSPSCLTPSHHAPLQSC